MNLQTHVSTRLWAAIEQSYEASNYKNAVLDGMHVITEVLREKAGVDADGHQLVGQALGGDAPRIRLNSLQTESEKNFQKGIEQILRGMYLAIRNPRSHELSSDERETAESILIFIDYLLAVLVASSEAFTMDSFLKRVLDPDFVDSDRYAILIVGEIPPLHYGDALATLFEHRRTIPLNKREHLIAQLTQKLSEPQLASFLAKVSAELKLVSEELGVRTALQLLEPDHWLRIEESARLRIESKLLKSIQGGEVGQNDKLASGALGTWAGPILKHFGHKPNLASALILKLRSEKPNHRRYVAKYFLSYLPGTFDDDDFLTQRFVRAIGDATKGGDESVRENLIEDIVSFPDTWTSKLVAYLVELTDPRNPAVVLKDGTPFLTALPETREELFDDDIPF